MADFSRSSSERINAVYGALMYIERMMSEGKWTDKVGIYTVCLDTVEWAESFFGKGTDNLDTEAMELVLYAEHIADLCNDNENYVAY